MGFKEDIYSKGIEQGLEEIENWVEKTNLEYEAKYLYSNFYLFLLIN